MKIFIGGDSWARGEHPNFHHLGLQQYFVEEGYQVINSSVLGASNYDSIDILNNDLREQYQSGDLIFWVQTDPLRDLRGPKPLYHRLVPQITSAKGIYSLMDILLHNSYRKLEAVGNNYSATIYAIGGLCSVGDVGLFNFINPIVTSWPRLLVGDIPKYKQVDWSKFAIWCSDWTAEQLGINPIVYDHDLAKKVILEADELNQNRKIFNEPIFSPDGQHPNRYGHKILYDYIKAKLKI